MNYKTVYTMVHDKWGTKLKVPRKTHEKNAVASVAFCADFSQHVADAIAEKRCDFQSVRVFSQDETRYGLLPVSHRRITLRGIKPVIEINPRYDSVYLYGAVEPLTGERFFLEFSHLTSECFQCFIEKFSKAFGESLNLLVLDNGRFIMPNRWRFPRMSFYFSYHLTVRSWIRLNVSGKTSKSSYLLRRIKRWKLCKRKLLKFF